ncbi:MAG: PIN domain-containing protein [Spirochaetales bacterium]|jgi:predicted nucleic-acid-binding protein|nr:PIN domain-containing protein [Spirochaetales bacterium]
MPKPVVLDTNAVIHFVQALDMPKFEIVAQTLNNNQCYVPVEVIVETVYILNDRFRNDREIIAAKLKDFIAIQDGLVPETNAIAFGLNLYASSKLDFVDCLLAGYAKVKRCLVLTFDSGLKKELAGQAYLP